MLEQSSTFRAALLAVLSIGMVLAVDLFMFSLQLQPQAIPHLAVGVLTAQLLSLLVFYKGEICPGQCARLVKVNLVFALYWVVWLVISLLPAYHYTLTNLMSLCGLSVVYFIYKQPKAHNLRNGFLRMAALVAGFGLLSYLMLFGILPLGAFVEYNPLAPMLAGVVLANLTLVIARNRLQGFIALLPPTMVLLLAFNAVLIFILILFGGENEPSAEGVFAYAIYFVCHFAIAAILVIHSLQKWTLSTNSLFILLFIASCLPLWMLFV